MIPDQNTMPTKRIQAREFTYRGSLDVPAPGGIRSFSMRYPRTAVALVASLAFAGTAVVGIAILYWIGILP